MLVVETMRQHPAIKFSAWLLLAVTLFSMELGLGVSSALAKDKESAKQQAERVARLPEKYQQWLAEVDVLLSKEELVAFLDLKEDYHRDAFIARFWKARDPYPDTARNEYKDRFVDLLSHARTTFGDLKEARAQMLLIHGEPAEVRKVQCSTILWPTEIWHYAGSERARYEFFLVFYRRFGGTRYEIWRLADGLAALFQEGFGASQPDAGALLGTIRNSCFRGDEVAAIFGSILNQGLMGYELALSELTAKPKAPEGEWITTFNSYSTDLPAGAAQFLAELKVLFPGRRQSRTMVEGIVVVPRDQVGVAQLAEFRSYNFVLTGEVLAGTELFDSFRYKFDFPANELQTGDLPMIFERRLRPGTYRLLLKLEDLNGQKFFRVDQALVVPEVGDTPLPPDPETARLLAEAQAILAMGELAVKLFEPPGELLTGMHRIDTLVTGGSGVTIDRMSFRLDGKEILAKKKPPFSVELDLGSLPRPRTLEAVAIDTAGREIASDKLLLNATPHRFSLRLVEPRRGASYGSSLVARAEVEAPEGRSIERVEFFVNETKVATLYQPPYEQPILLPKEEPVAYVQAVAYLPDGNSTQDLVFVNAPGLLEELDIQFVELYTTVIDRGQRPVLGLNETSFQITEDGVPQEIQRFEQVRDLPIHAAVALDVSASMAGRLLPARDAALSFFQQILTPKDRAAVITFNDRPTLTARFTNELGSLAGGLAGLKAERGTALYDSLIFSLYYFNGIKGQRALLLLSDGKDEGSRFKYEDALEYARRSGVTVYAIGLDLGKGEARRQLEKIAEETGGRGYFISDVAELQAIYAAIEEELRSQYLLAYQSTNTTRSNIFRSIEVKVEGSGLEAKTLRGYYP